MFLRVDIFSNKNRRNCHQIWQSITILWVFMILNLPPPLPCHPPHPWKPGQAPPQSWLSPSCPRLVLILVVHHLQDRWSPTEGEAHTRIVGPGRLKRFWFNLQTNLLLKDKCILETIVDVTMLTFQERKVIDRELLEPRRLHANLAQTWSRVVEVVKEGQGRRRLLRDLQLTVRSRQLPISTRTWMQGFKVNVKQDERGRVWVAWLGWSNWGDGGEKMTFKKRRSQNSMVNANSACTRMWV